MSEQTETPVIALAGNPNVGKSTVFNALTGLKQHTGNWTGKTGSCASGMFTYQNTRYLLVDLPGTYSLIPASPEEEVAREFLCSDTADAVVIVSDATCLERNLNLVLQILQLTNRVVLCVNLLDEAKKKNISIDLELLSKMLGISVVGTAARGGDGLVALQEAIASVANAPRTQFEVSFDPSEDAATALVETAERIYHSCVTHKPSHRAELDRKADRLLTSKHTGIPLMILLLGGILWLTIIGANYPSALLTQLFSVLEGYFTRFLQFLQLPVRVIDALSSGMFRTLGWVVAVMLPPMAIFFPLFTLLEDVGYLPRIAFNLDCFFHRASAHGKQALTMCMGFGCNACGVTGCRIIDSPRERMIAILTNVFVPCNGRFPTLIAMIGLLFAGQASTPLQSVFSAGVLTAVIVFGVVITLLVSRLLSKTILRGLPSTFALELPPYRRPQFGTVFVRSLLDRTLFVLGRAAAVAAPAGLILWVLANVQIGRVSLLSHLTGFFDPFARVIGLDGVILVAFFLGFPANEIVLPIALMCYQAGGSLVEYESLSSLYAVLTANGWTACTAICTMLFSLCHFPCATTCLTIYKETKSICTTLLAILLPTAVGILLCFTVATLFRVFA